MNSKTIDRLKDQTAEYLRVYQEQKRLSPEDISKLSNEVIETQANRIKELELEIAILESTVRYLEHSLKWANEMARALAQSVERMIKLRGGKLWEPNDRSINAGQKEEERAKSPGHEDHSSEERD